MPAELIASLSLGDAMVTTRAAAAKAARNRPASPEQMDNDNQAHSSTESSPSASPAPSLVISTNNIQYNVSAFDGDLRKRVKRGMQDNEIRMKYCAVSDDDSSPDSTKYFYLDDDITVAMGGKLHQPKCTCGANENGLACKHIYWVGDQIISALPNKEEVLEKQPFEVSSDGSKFQDLEPAERLVSEGIDWIADQLKWVLRDEDLPEHDEDLRHSIITMLSVFEPEGALPREFEYPESPLKSERSKKYQDFADLLTLYAVRDPGLFLGVRKIIDPGFQCRVFFEKIDNRIIRTFNALDEYIKHGSMNTSPDTLRFDVPSCARELTCLVKAIDEFYHEHNEDDPGTRDVAMRAADALLTILDRVTDRDGNAYEEIAWDIEIPADPAENNLFIALIARHGAPFVLAALESLPQEDVHRNHWEILTHIQDKLARSTSTPATYMDAFRKVVYENRKRPASEDRHGESKRPTQ